MASSKNIVVLVVVAAATCTVLLMAVATDLSAKKPVELLGSELKQKEWHVLAPGDVSSVAAKRYVKHGDAVKQRNSLNTFFGIQHFKGDGLATSGRGRGMEPSQKLGQKAALSAPQGAARFQQLKQAKNGGKSYDKNTGYLNAGQYQQYLQATSVAGQKSYMKDWHAKNLAAAKDAMKGAAKLYQKWELVDPHTGYSKPDLKIPGDEYWAARGKRAALRTQKLMEITADNGKSYTLPWWCIGVHPEANGQGVGWDGAVAAKGTHGPGTDCTPPFQMAQQGRLQQLAEEGEKSEEGGDEELGDEIIEVGDGDGDVQIPAEELVPTIFAGHGPFP